MRRTRRRRVVRVSVDVGAAVGDRRERHVRENERHLAIDAQDGANVVETVDAQLSGTGQVVVADNQDLGAPRAFADTLPGGIA